MQTAKASIALSGDKRNTVDKRVTPLAAAAYLDANGIDSVFDLREFRDEDLSYDDVEAEVSTLFSATNKTGEDGLPYNVGRNTTRRFESKRPATFEAAGFKAASFQNGKIPAAAKAKADEKS